MTELARLQASAKQAAALLKAVNYPRRLLILCVPNDSPDTSTGELTRITGLSASAISQHLVRMWDEEPTDSQWDAQCILYSIKNETINAIIATLKNVCCPQGVTMALTTISPYDTQGLIARGVKLIDIHNAGEHPCERVPKAGLTPLSVLEQSSLPAKSCREQIVFHCQAGKCTNNNVDKLAATAVPAEIFLLEDGIDNWKKAGLSVAVNKSQPLPLMRQMQIAVGGLILVGVILGYTVNGGFFLSSGSVGAELLFVEISGFCGMTRLLDKMPWDQRA